jgi:hypothetical protein
MLVRVSQLSAEADFHSVMTLSRKIFQVTFDPRTMAPSSLEQASSLGSSVEMERSRVRVQISLQPVLQGEDDTHSA